MGAAALSLALLAASAAVAGPLDYPGGPFDADVREVARTARLVEYEVRFPSPVKSPFAPNDTVWGHLLVPRRASRAPLPAILVLPVMAAPNVWIERRFMNHLVREGFAVLWLEMPYQFHRRPDPSIPSGQVFLARTARRLAANFRQSVLDARRALSWLKTRPEVDADRIGLFGISLGAMVGAGVYSVDPTPSRAVFLLGGADFSRLAMTSSMTRKFVESAGIQEAPLREAFRGIDPLDYKDGNAGKEALLINVGSDTVIPRSNALKLREAFPAARQIWLPFGHYTAILHLIWIPGYVSRDFRLNL